MMHPISPSSSDKSDEAEIPSACYAVLSPPEDDDAAGDLHYHQAYLSTLSTTQSDSTSDSYFPRGSPPSPCSFRGPSPSPTHSLSRSPSPTHSSRTPSPTHSSQSPSPTHSSESPSPTHSSAFSTTSSSSGGRGSRRKYKFIRGKKHYLHIVDEEKCYYGADDIEEDERRKALQFRCFAILLAICAIFATFCAVYLRASKPYKVSVLIERLEVDHLYYGEGSDHTGVPTKLLTANCSATMSIRNPATYFGVHISSNPINLMFSELTIANGQIDRYYQPRNSMREKKVGLVGYNVPLYGTGEHLAASDEHGGIPLRLKFDVHSIGYLIGKLVEARHTRHVSCSLVISSKYTKEIKLEHNCEYS